MSDSSHNQDQVVTADPSETENQAIENENNDAEKTLSLQLAETQQSLAEALEQINHLKDEYLFARAESENIRRRSEEDLLKQRKYGLEKWTKELLPVKDSIEMALLTENQDVESLKKGVELILKEVNNLFEKCDLREINPIDMPFNPNEHQAISTEVVADKTTNTVVKVLQKGYFLNDRVIRPAIVTVAQ